MDGVVRRHDHHSDVVLRRDVFHGRHEGSQKRGSGDEVAAAAVRTLRRHAVGPFCLRFAAAAKPGGITPCRNTKLTPAAWSGIISASARSASGDQPTIGGSIYFENAKTDLTDEQKRQLDLQAKDLAGKPQKIEIRGHTVCRPQGPTPSIRDNWDLAYERCHKTMEYLVSLGIDPRRIRIGVSAQYEPLYTGRDPLLLEQNNRVEVFMLSEFAEEVRSNTGETAND